MMLSRRPSLLGFLFIGMVLTLFPPMSHGLPSYTLTVTPLTPASIYSAHLEPQEIAPERFFMAGCGSYGFVQPQRG